MHQVNYKKSDATFGKLQANNSHGFPGCGFILMLIFLTYLFLPSLLHSSCFYLLSSSIYEAFRAVSETRVLSSTDGLIHIFIYASSIYLSIYAFLSFFP